MDLPNYSLFDMMLIKSTPVKRRSMKKKAKKVNGTKVKAEVFDHRRPAQIENDRLMEEFLAKGGKVEVIPSGISGADYYGVSNSNWKKRSRKSY